MGQLTPLAVTLLALLRERPMHPYEMHQTLLDRHQDRLVKVRPGSLYHTVERLCAAGFVTVESVAREGNRPERTTYRITPDGRNALAERVSELLRERSPEFPAFPVGLGEAQWLTREQAIAELKHRLGALEDDLRLISDGVAGARDRGIDAVVLLSGNYLAHMLSAEHEWITRTIERIETEEYSWPNN